MYPSLALESALSSSLADLGLEQLRSVSRKFTEHRQQSLCSLLLSAYEQHRPHQSDPLAVSFTKQFLGDTLRAHRNSKTVDRLISPFFTYPAGNRGYSKSARETKPYRLREHAQAAVERAVTGRMRLPVVWRSDDGSPSDAPIPENGIPEPHGTRGLFVPPVIALSSTAVDEALTWVENGIRIASPRAPLDADRPDGLTLETTRRRLWVCRQWAVSLGGIPNLYREQRFGRLGPARGSAHIISLPSMLRRLLFADRELVDYDLRSAHFSLFMSLGQAFGLPTDATREYLSNKTEIHRRWGRMVAWGNLNDFKRLTASFLTGGSLAPTGRSSAGRVLGPARLKQLQQDPFAAALYRETSAGMKTLVAAATMKEGRDHSLTNATGNTYTMTKSRSDFGKAASCLLTGFEQWVIREICRHMPGLQGIIYDGFVAPEQNVGAMETQLRQRSTATFGFPLEVSIKATPLSSTPTAYEPDPGDF